MKKFLPLILISLAIILCSYKEYLYKRGENVLKSGVSLVSVDHTRILMAFMDNDTYKIGFLHNQSLLTVLVPPIYDDAYNSGTLLYPIKKDGLWGVMDLGGRFFDPHGVYNFKKPIIPCKYKKIEIIDDYVAVCDGIRIDVRKLGYEED